MLQYSKASYMQTINALHVLLIFVSPDLLQAYDMEGRTSMFSEKH
jgi:hypothetical protein